MQRDDTAYLLDILIAANKATGYIHDLTYKEFEKKTILISDSVAFRSHCRIINDVHLKERFFFFGA